MDHFPGWVATRDDATNQCELRELEPEFLDDLPVTIRVHHSGINYKDALALHGKPGMVRRFPLVVGIDLVGEVVESQDDAWRPGDMVALTGAGLGEDLHGGLAGLARVAGEHLVAVPRAFTSEQVAAIGTAGFTAALCVEAIVERGVTSGPVLVTGASGGVGSIAVSLLARAGFDVIAATGRVEEQGGALRELGAGQVIDRNELTASSKPLQTERWVAAVDTLGGDHLAGLLASVKRGGVVAACGLAASPTLSTTVMPFILRGVRLEGIDSVHVASQRRARAWQRLAEDLAPEHLGGITRTVPLEQAKQAAAELLAGRGTGRVVVQVLPDRG